MRQARSQTGHKQTPHDGKIKTENPTAQSRQGSGNYGLEGLMFKEEVPDCTSDRYHDVAYRLDTVRTGDGIRGMELTVSSTEPPFHQNRRGLFY